MAGAVDADEINGEQGTSSATESGLARPKRYVNAALKRMRLPGIFGGDNDEQSQATEHPEKMTADTLTKGSGHTVEVYYT